MKGVESPSKTALHVIDVIKVTCKTKSDFIVKALNSFVDERHLSVLFKDFDKWKIGKWFTSQQIDYAVY